MLSSSILNRFYYKVLFEGYGVGKDSVTNKDYILSYLGQNSAFVNYKNDTYMPTDSTASKFTGILNVDGTVTQGLLTLFFDNDQAAYQAGLNYHDCYYLSQTNTYGLPMGIPKIITEDEET
mgnify:FL=1